MSNGYDPIKSIEEAVEKISDEETKGVLYSLLNHIRSLDDRIFYLEDKETWRD